MMSLQLLHLQEHLILQKKAAKTANCYPAANGDDRVTFTYTGEAGTITFSTTGGYIPKN